MASRGKDATMSGDKKSGRHGEPDSTARSFDGKSPAGRHRFDNVNEAVTVEELRVTVGGGRD